MTHLRHPVTGGEFDAPDSAVPQFQRAGWVVIGSHDPAVTAPATSTTKAGTAEVAAKTEE